MTDRRGTALAIVATVLGLAPHAYGEAPLAALATSVAPTQSQAAADETRASFAALATPEQAAAFAVELEALAAAGVPTADLMSRLQEGRAKGVPGPRIAAALLEMARRQRWLAEALTPCARPPANAARAASDRVALAALVPVGADLLASGVARDQLASVIPSLCASDAPLDRLRTSAEIQLYLTGRLAAKADAAWALARHALTGALEQAAATRLLATLQAIHRRAGSVDNAARHVGARLTAGASPRTIRNELRELFLRR